jgi:hypothetical protein
MVWKASTSTVKRQITPATAARIRIDSPSPLHGSAVFCAPPVHCIVAGFRLKDRPLNELGTAARGRGVVLVLGVSRCADCGPVGLPFRRLPKACSYKGQHACVFLHPDPVR